MNILLGLLPVVLTALTVPVTQLIRAYVPQVNKTWAFFLGPLLAVAANWAIGAPETFNLPAWTVALAAPLQTWLYELAKRFGWTEPAA